MNMIDDKDSSDAIFSNQEQIYEFYETLRNTANDSIPQFQAILEVFVCDILKYRKEVKRLEESFKREKDTNEKYLRRIEEDQERDMCELEERVRQDERQKFEIERELLQQRATKEISDLQGSIQRLKTIEQVYVDRKNDEDSSLVVLRQEIAKLTEENQALNASLNDSLTANAILESDLQSFRTQLNERQTMLLQEKQSSSSNYREKESLQTNVRHLVEVNKKLRDENDSLRASIETYKANKFNVPQSLNIPSPKRLISSTGSTLGSYWHDSRLDSPSPSYITSANQRRFDSFDIESTDEIGILGSGFRANEKLVNNNPPKLALPLVTGSTLHDATDESNYTNDSGLSITTVREVTEAESDRNSNSNKQTSTKNVKQARSLNSKQNTADTDSDEVFDEPQFDRLHPKRASQQRSLRRTANNARSLARHAANIPPAIEQPPAPKSMDEPEVQSDLPFDRLFKVVFCGDAAVGKTTLIMRICKGKFMTNANSTLGVDFQNKQVVVDSKRIAIQLWDTAGQERFRSIAKSYFRRCDGVILVYDTAYERSFLNVREWINIIVDSTPKKVSVMIVANKIDLRDQVRAEGRRVIETAEGAKLAKEHQALFMEMSAKDGTNSKEVLVELARDMQCNEDLERFRTAGVDLDKRANKTTCCST